MALNSRTPNPRYSALRYGAALLTLPLFLAACGGANTAGKQYLLTLHGERLSNGKHHAVHQLLLILRRRSRISRSRQARPAHR